MTNQAPPFQSGAPSSESPVSALQTLDRRSREIFRQIVESYLGTGEPVGSRHISRRLPVTLSPASVRNVMADLESLGLIYAPHTSAGRLPTEYGLRFFVDALLEVGDLAVEERRQIEAQVKAADPGRTVEIAPRRREPGAVGPVARRRRRARRQGRHSPQARRVHPDRADARPGGAGRRGRIGREPADRSRPGHDAIGADRGRQLPQHPHPRPNARRRPGRDGTAGSANRAPSSTGSPASWSTPASHPGRRPPPAIRRR